MPLPIISSGGASNSQSFNQLAHGFAVGDELFITGNNTFAKADSDSAVSSEWVGTVIAVTDVNNFILRYTGVYVTDKTGLTPAQVYYVSGTAGALTSTEPSSVSSVSKPVFVSLNTTSGFYKDFRGTPAQGQTAVISTFNAHDETTDAGGTGIYQVTSASATVNFQTAFPSTQRLTISANNSGSLTQSGNIITIPITGRYEINSNFIYEPGTLNAVGVQIVKNGTTVLGTGITNSSSGDKQPSVTTYNGNLTAGDTIDFRFGGNSSAQARFYAYNISIIMIGASPVPMDLAGEYGENNGITNGQTIASGSGFVNVTGGSFTLPSAGIWEVTYNAFSNNTSAGFRSRFQLVKNSDNSVVPNSATDFVTTSNGFVNESTQTVRIITAGATVYNFQGYADNGTVTIYNTNANGGGNSKIVWKKISGFIPSSGQSVDYVNVRLNAGTLSVAAGAAIAFDTVNSGNIPYSAGVFTLTAGKTYRLTAHIAAQNSSGFADFQWRDIGSNTLLGNRGSSMDMAYANSASGVQTAEAIYTPSSNTTVRLESIGAKTYTGSNSTNGASTASIVQLGSSNVIAGLYPGTWGTYTPTITAVTTNPTKPSSGIVIDTASYIVEGKKLTVNYTFWIGTAVGAAAGSGTYKFSLPPGIVIDTTKITTIASVEPTLINPNIANILGTVELNRGSQTSLTSKALGHVYAADANNFTAAAMISAYSTLSMFDSVTGNTALQSGIGWKMQFTVPIV